MAAQTIPTPSNVEVDPRTAAEAEDEEATLTYNMDYVLGKLMQASRNANQPKIRKWETFLSSNQAGLLDIGGRTPVAGAPSWVTLEVATGGFATGGFMAGGPLESHEREYFKFFFKTDPKDEKECRQKLNEEFLTTHGMQYLSHLLETSQFAIRVPEEGALMAIVWLCNNNHEKEASDIWNTIAPFFDRLRFYPIPSLTPLTMGAEVSVASVSDAVDALAAAHTPALMVQNRQTVEEVLPAYDALIAAVLKTTKGQRVPEVSKENDKVVFVGDLPFEVVDAEKQKEIKDAYDKIERLDAHLRQSQRFRVGHLKLFLDIVKKFLNAREKLTPRNCEVARMIIAQVNKKRGLPGSPKLGELRGKQKKSVERVGAQEQWSKILIDRLRPDVSKPGLANVHAVLHPVQKNEVMQFVPEGATVPANLVEKVKRSKLAPLEELCGDGLVPSGEVLAVLCPTLVANVISQGISDRTLAPLFGAIYQAFKNRRSLLLLNLEKQVGIQELPWFSALGKFKKSGAAANANEKSTQGTLEDIVMLALKYWPETILPNKLVGVLYDLSVRCYNEKGTRGIPFMKELASDIFMGEFSGTFLANAKLAASMMKGTLYESYYEMDFDKIANFKNEAALGEYCGAVKGRWGNVTENGKTIERCMIVTTHNLALVFEQLNVKERLSGILPELPRKVFNFIVRETNNLTGMDWQTRLQHLKNAAYAFRQMVFYLSLLSKEDQASFFEWVFARCEKIKDADYKTRLMQPVKSLHATWKGEKEADKTIFLGWVAGGERHFLMPPKKDAAAKN